MTAVNLNKLERDIDQMLISASDVSINAGGMLDFYARALDDVRERPDDFGIRDDARDSVMIDLTEAVDELRDAARDASVLCELMARARSELSGANKDETRHAAAAHTLEQSIRVAESAVDAIDGAETCFDSAEYGMQEHALTSEALKKLDDLSSDARDVSSRLREAEVLASEIARSSRVGQ